MTGFLLFKLLRARRNRSIFTKFFLAGAGDLPYSVCKPSGGAEHAGEACSPFEDQASHLPRKEASFHIFQPFARPISL